MVSTIIYVYLIDEGVDVWRPVQATQISSELFQIDPNAVVLDSERWQFQPGQTVRCRWRMFETGEGFEAFELVS
jgi:hypothetical protein